MGATQKRKPKIATTGLSEEVVKPTTKVTVPDVTKAIKKTDAALAKVDNVKKTVKRRVYKNKRIKVCSTCGKEGCEWPDRAGSNYWVYKIVKTWSLEDVEGD